MLAICRDPVPILLGIDRRLQRRRSVQRERWHERVADLRRQLRRILGILELVFCGDLWRRHPVARILGVDYCEERWCSLQRERWGG